MKCIKVVNQTKSYKLGTIQRVSDIVAEANVSTGIWAFCPKLEWKLATRKPQKEKTEVKSNKTISDSIIEGVSNDVKSKTSSKPKSDRKKSKK
jgi:hypothetical protein